MVKLFHSMCKRVQNNIMCLYQLFKNQFVSIIIILLWHTSVPMYVSIRYVKVWCPLNCVRLSCSDAIVCGFPFLSLIIVVVIGRFYIGPIYNNRAPYKFLYLSDRLFELEVTISQRWQEIFCFTSPVWILPNPNLCVQIICLVWKPTCTSVDCFPYFGKSRKNSIMYSLWILRQSHITAW